MMNDERLMEKKLRLRLRKKNGKCVDVIMEEGDIWEIGEYYKCEN